MIVGIWVGDAETDGHFVEKRWVSTFLKVRADVEDDLVCTGLELFPREKWPLGPSIVVRVDGLDDVPSTVLSDVCQLDFYAGGRSAIRRIQDVGGKETRQDQPVLSTQPSIRP